MCSGRSHINTYNDINLFEHPYTCVHCLPGAWSAALAPQSLVVATLPAVLITCTGHLHRILLRSYHQAPKAPMTLASLACEFQGTYFADVPRRHQTRPGV